MHAILTTLQSHLPHKRKTTPSGWTSFNAVCCHNRGENRDTRARGGILQNDISFQYHCFNCNFKAGWSLGKSLSSNTKKLMQWLGVDDSEITRLSLEALKTKEDIPKTKKEFSSEIKERQLPELSKSLVDWANEDLAQEEYESLLEIFKYLNFRGMNIDWYPWHWSPSPGYKDRLLIPFYQDNKIVGFTGRKITEGKPKYLSDAQPGYVFNIDRQTQDKDFVIVVEGQFDAIAVDGVAIMHNEPNQVQVQKIKSLNKEVIVVPDRDKAGAKLLNAAIANDWHVSLPPWDTKIKDVADAVKTYGRIYTMYSILRYKESNKIKIEILKRKLEHA